MARRFGGRGVAVLLGGVAVGVVLAYLRSGRGGNDAPLIPDVVEEEIDRLVEFLNGTFGHRWVDLGLDVLQAEIERTTPALAVLVGAVHRAEQAYGRYRNVGGAKRLAAMRHARTPRRPR